MQGVCKNIKVSVPLYSGLKLGGGGGGGGLRKATLNCKVCSRPTGEDAGGWLHIHYPLYEVTSQFIYYYNRIILMYIRIGKNQLPY